MSSIQCILHSAQYAVHYYSISKTATHSSGAHDRLMDFIDHLNRKSLPTHGLTACARSVT